MGVLSTLTGENNVYLKVLQQQRSVEKVEGGSKTKVPRKRKTRTIVSNNKYFIQGKIESPHPTAKDSTFL